MPNGPFGVWRYRNYMIQHIPRLIPQIFVNRSIQCIFPLFPLFPLFPFSPFSPFSSSFPGFPGSCSMSSIPWRYSLTTFIDCCEASFSLVGEHVHAGKWNNAIKRIDAFRMNMIMMHKEKIAKKRQQGAIFFYSLPLGNTL